MKYLLSQKKFLLIAVILFILIGALIGLFILSSAAPKATINYASSAFEVEANNASVFANELKVTKSDITIGRQDAPIQVISYDSFSCHHCANFFENVFPLIEKKYIETGKILFIHRDFPLDMQALNATKLLKCFVSENQGADDSRIFNLINAVYVAQKDWVNSDANSENLSKIFQFAGLKEKEISDCLKDEELENRILEERLKASRTLKITGTPTFFINGQKMQRAPTFNEFDREFSTILSEQGE